MNIPDSIKNLLVLPRFWVLVIALVTSIYLYTQGAITAEQLSLAFVALATLVVAALTVENATKTIMQSKERMNAENNANARVLMSAHSAAELDKIEAQHKLEQSGF